jgi:hypothetical protein
LPSERCSVLITAEMIFSQLESRSGCSKPKSSDQLGPHSSLSLLHVDYSNRYQDINILINTKLSQLTYDAHLHDCVEKRTNISTGIP